MAHQRAAQFRTKILDEVLCLHDGRLVDAITHGGQQSREGRPLTTTRLSGPRVLPTSN